MKQNLLAGLPDDTIAGTSGSPVGSLRGKIDERLQTVMDMSSKENNVISLLKSASDEMAITFFNLYMESGEGDARLWLQQQTEQAK